MKKRLSYLFQLLFAITLFLGYSVTVNAATYNMNYEYLQKYYDNNGSTVTAVTTTWNESLQSYVSNNITTIANSYGAGLSITSPIPLIANHTYTLSVYFDGISNIAKSSKNNIAISTSLTGAASNYANNNFYVDMIQTSVSNNSIIQFVFTTKGGGNYIFFPWTTTSNSTHSYVLTQISMEDLGSEGISQQDINNSLNSQTNELNNSIQNSTNIITGVIDDMEQNIIDSNKETQDVIKDQFNSCRDSYNLFNGTPKELSGGISTTYKDNKYILNGTMTSTYFNITNTYNTSLESGTYTLSIDRELPFDLLLLFHVDGIRNDIVIVHSNTSKTFTVNGNISSYYIWARTTNSGLELNNLEFKVQLQKGNIATSYEPPNEEICTNKIDETNDKLDDVNNTSKGIWETLKSIPNLILEGIKGLFVPSKEELQSLIDEFKQTMENKLGAIYQVSDMLIDVFRSIFSPTERNSCITFPEIKDPMFNKLIIEQTDYCFDSLRTDFDFLFTISDMIISIVCTLAFGNMLYKKYEGFIGGDTSDY